MHAALRISSFVDADKQTVTDDDGECTEAEALDAIIAANRALGVQLEPATTATVRPITDRESLEASNAKR